MSLRWHKLGRVLCATGQRPWMRSHTALPTPLPLATGQVRVYFGTRDATARPHIGCIDFDPASGVKPESLCQEPVLGPGAPGHFDDNGVYPGPVVEQDAKLWMYYLGRSNGIPPLYYMAIGLAVSEDGGQTFQRALQAPLMARSEYDPWMVSTPFLLREGPRWRMWYLSGLGWNLEARPPHSRYHIKYAESRDGRMWARDGHVCIGLRDRETNIASPTVIRDRGGYLMWYSRYARDGYRIGFAESADGYLWERKDDQAGIDLSPSGWDSESMSYPAAFPHQGQRYLLYSGNGFGRDGFGLAVEK